MAGNNANGTGGNMISSLQDDLLIRFLLGLTTVEAIRTCILSPLWRDVWTRLPELSFIDYDTDAMNLRFADFVDGTLRGLAPDAVLCFLEFYIANSANMDMPRLAAWAREVARRVTGKLRINLAAADPHGHTVFELPCFPRARDIFLFLTAKTEFRLPKPSTGAFPCLNVLDLFHLRFSDGGASLGALVSSSCPRLQYMRLSNVLGVTELIIKSKTLLELELFLLQDLERLIIEAMKLDELAVSCCYLRKLLEDASGTELSVVAPMLAMVTWEGFCPQVMHFDASRHLEFLEVCEFKPNMTWLQRPTNYSRIMKHFSHVDVLKLFISFPVDIIAQKILIEEMRLPRCEELELNIARNDHALGPTLICLLKKLNDDTKYMSCSIYDNNLEQHNLCSDECTCDAPETWRDQEISFDSLEHMEFRNITRTGRETDFIYFMCGHCSALKTVLIEFTSPTDPRDICDDLAIYLPDDCPIYVSTSRR